MGTKILCSNAGSAYFISLNLGIEISSHRPCRRVVHRTSQQFFLCSETWEAKAVIAVALPLIISNQGCNIDSRNDGGVPSQSDAPFWPSFFFVRLVLAENSVLSISLTA